MFSVLEKQHEGGMAGGISEVRVVGDEVEEVFAGIRVGAVVLDAG